MNDSARLTRLEETLTHLQRHVIEQDKAMLALADDLARLRQKLARLRIHTVAEPGDTPPSDERPPHY